MAVNISSCQCLNFFNYGSIYLSCVGNNYGVVYNYSDSSCTKNSGSYAGGSGSQIIDQNIIAQINCPYYNVCNMVPVKSEGIKRKPLIIAFICYATISLYLI